MIGLDHSKISFSDILVLPFRKTTLPAKIIQLRKVSQDSHVRRMKIAHQRKQMQPPSDAFMNLASTVPRRNASSLQTPFTTPKIRLDVSDAEYNYSLDKNQCSSSTHNRNNFSPKILDSSLRKRDNHSRSTHLKIFENSFDFNKRNVKSDTTIAYKESGFGKYSSDLKDTTPTVFSGNNKCQKQTEVYKSKTSNNKIDNATLRFSQKHKNQLNDSKTPNQTVLNKNADRTDSKDYSYINKSFQDKDSSKRMSRYSSVSRIPISLTRLPCKEQNITSHLLSSDNSNKYSQTDKSSPSKLQIELVIRNSKEAEENDISECQNKFMNIENEERSIKDTITGCFTRDLKYFTSNNACSHNCRRDVHNKEEQLLSNPLTSVSSWLNDNVHTNESNKNSSVSRLAPNNDTDSVTRRKKVLRMNINTKSSENSDLTRLKSSNEQSESIENSSSGSDASLEYYYDTETGNDTLTQDEDENEWKEDSDDEESMVTVPTSKSKSSDTSKKFVSQKMPNDPDYPKTPYYLRYPRYKSKESDSMKKYAETPSTRMKTPKSKSRKKSLKSTPKRKRGNKSKRNLNFTKQDGQS